VAYDDFRIVRDNLNGANRTTRGRLVPFCMFTDPELTRVGLNESEAQRLDIAYRVAKAPMAAVLRTRTLSEPRGFMKMLLDETSDRILGFTVLEAEASELVAAVQTAMLGQLPFTVLRDALFTHPTAAEGLTVLLADVASAKGVPVVNNAVGRPRGKQRGLNPLVRNELQVRFVAKHAVNTLMACWPAAQSYARHRGPSFAIANNGPSMRAASTMR
jgi:hypothetical protein